MARWMTTAVLLLHTTLLPAQGGGQEETALRQLWSQFEEAFHRSDAARVASLYAPDGDRINRDLEIARGRAEIARQYEKEFAARKADPSTIPFRAQLTIRLLDASVALLDGEWEGFQKGKRVRGQFTVIAKKEGGAWQIAAGRVRGLKEL